MNFVFTLDVYRSPVFTLPICLDATWQTDVVLCGAWCNGLDLENGLQEISDDLVLALLSGVFDLFDLSLGLLVCLVLSRLVSMRMLQKLVSGSLLFGPFVTWATYLGLELLELLLLGVAVRLNLLLGFVASFLYPLCAD